MQETRSSARITTRFCVAVDGIEPELTPRAGNISATGIYFESDRDVGAVGTVQWLHIASADMASWMSVMACVARVLELVEGGRRLRGVAFQFMPLSEDQASQLQDFVRYVLASAPDEGPEAAITNTRLPAQAAAKEEIPTEAVVSRLSVRGLVLDTTWPVEEGSTVRVEIAAPGLAQALTLKGRAVRVRTTSMIESDPRYQIELKVHDEKGSRPRAVSDPPPPRKSTAPGTAPPPAPSSPSMLMRAAGRVPSDRPSAPQPVDPSVSNTLDQLFSAIITRPAEAPPPPRQHLSGNLERIRLPTLFALAEMERMSGVLQVMRDDERGRVYLREGRIVDVEPLTGGNNYRQELARLCAWDRGGFEFLMEQVDRADVVATTTTALLLDLAREDDEKNRDKEDRETEPELPDGDTI